jgi:dynein heavy chain
MVGAGTIAYTGAFTGLYRDMIVKGWHAEMEQLQLPFTPNCNVISVLSDPVKIRAWNIYGLPTDTLSIENGIIMSKARRWPLFIDPQGQANKFIKSMSKESENGTDVVKLTDKNFLRTIENAIRFGKWVLLENIMEELDPALEPLLQRAVIVVNGVAQIKLGENTIPYNDSFRFYMTTKLPNPHYSPELQVKVTLLNFTITPEGLEDQMLGIAVAKELPEVEAKKIRLMMKNADMKKQLQDIENAILKELSSSEGDLLDNITLIDTLAASKKTSDEINEALAEAAVVEVEIDESRKAYVPVAKRASILYFTISNFSLVDPMYQYSLQWFVGLFVQSIAAAEAADDIAVRLENLNDCFTQQLYENICRSLFEDHKLMFSFLICVNIMAARGQIDSIEYRFLVASGLPGRQLTNPAPDWLSSSVWNEVLALAALPSFADFDQSVIDNLATYKNYYEAPVPHLEHISEPFQSTLTQFQKLMIVRCFRPDKMVLALRDFVAANIGAKYIDPPPFDLRSSFSSSNVKTPLIFVLSPGADPTEDLFKFADEMGFMQKFQYVSLGQGQGPVATKYMKSAMQRGGWVMLQNCHLAVSWLTTLEKLIEDIDPNETDPSFRLWLTSMPSDKFPVSILQNGVKMTNEPPKGLRANLTRSYLGFTDAQLNDCAKPDQFKKMLYSVCFFHAVILDRRKFGPLGWNIPYQFTESDLAVVVAQLREFLNLFDDIPYKVIHFLTYDIHYGGRVTDDKDRTTMCNILDTFVNPSVLTDEYKFSPIGNYHSPPVGDRQHYLDVIREFPSVPEPEVFGLHPNADITCAADDCLRMCQTILMLLPRQAKGKGKSSDDIMRDTSKMILAELPELFDTDAIMKRYPTAYEESMNTVLIQESYRYNRLIEIMSKSLNNFMKALKGEVVMSNELEKMGTSIFNNQVPEMWSAVAPPSLMPLAAWVIDLKQRCNFLMSWFLEGIPKVFWISGFFFPQAFLTGTLQNYARRFAYPIDTISFSFKVMDMRLEDVTERPETGCYIRGLFLEGCRWDPVEQSLVDSNPRELFTKMPIIWLKPEKDRKPTPAGTFYNCPVYKTLTRAGTLSTTGHSTNFVVFVELPSKQPAPKWIKAGVAMFCSLRYIIE